MRRIQSGQVSLGAGETETAVLSKAWNGGGSRFALLLKVGDGDGTVAATLQGGWDASSDDDADWTDVGPATDADLNPGDQVQLGEVTINTWPVYRISFTRTGGTGQLVVQYRLMEFD